MQRYIALYRRLAWVPPTLTAWLLMAGAAFAAEEDKAPKENNWTMAYILVLLGVGLGLMVLCRPGKRKSDSED